MINREGSDPFPSRIAEAGKRIYELYCPPNACNCSPVLLGYQGRRSSFEGARYAMSVESENPFFFFAIAATNSLCVHTSAYTHVTSHERWHRPAPNLEKKLICQSVVGSDAELGVTSSFVLSPSNRSSSLCSCRLLCFLVDKEESTLARCQKRYICGLQSPCGSVSGRL